MLRHPEITRRRLQRTSEALLKLVRPERRAPDRLQVSGPVDRIPWRQAVELPLREATVGQQFGPAWSTYWFRVAMAVPAAWAGGPVDLVWDSRCEATAWIGGRSVQGLNAGLYNGARSLLLEHDRTDVRVSEAPTAGEQLEIWIEMACNDAFGLDGFHPLRTIAPAILERCEFAVFDPAAWDLHHDFGLLQALEAAADEGLDPTWRGRLLHELNRFCNAFNPDDRGSWPTARAILTPLLQTRNAERTHELSAIGHGHIDTAWLWPVAESYRKCERTFSTATTLMGRYPDYRFACSQAQQYEWVKTRNPELYERIKDRVASGQWVPVGGTWIEPDCNLPSGESLVRQFMFGQRFFEAEFGRRCTEFWNPDVFGYNGQLPQIMRGAGIERFLTQKLSWNAFTRPPYHTFRWEGIDGSQILAHFPPADTYNAEVTVEQLRFNAHNYKDHDRSANSLMLFGYGDGGGGPSAEMLERLARAGDLQGLPRTVMRSSEEFFSRLEQETSDWPSVVGELYFELHRGTYTTQAATKRANRRSEVLLHDIEALWAVARRRGDTADVPRQDTSELWKRVLLNQFHDILPGSSVAEVYADAAADYAHVQRAGGVLRNGALGHLGDERGPSRPVNLSGGPRREIVERAGDLVSASCPAFGVGSFDNSEPAVPVTLQRTRGGYRLRNEWLTVEVDDAGQLTSLIEATSGREALSGPANLLELYDDHPVEWDAWDIDPFHLETLSVVGQADAHEVVRDEPLRAEVRFRRPIGARSVMQQSIRLDAYARRVEFHCDVDWHEDHKVLKVAVPLAVRSMSATYEMQFGVVERPTHFNTAADLAKFEVPGHRFADLSEHGFGVAMLSDSKYGFSTLGHTMRMTLLRAPTWPDPAADRGQQSFAYALMPHAGSWQSAGVTHEARAFAMPLLAIDCESPERWIWCEDENLVLDTVKLAEDSDAIVLRLYEGHGARGRAHIRVELPFTSASRVTLLEDEVAAVPVENRSVVVDYGPFEIVSLMLA